MIWRIVACTEITVTDSYETQYWPQFTVLGNFHITDEEDSPVIRGFSDDEPLVIAWMKFLYPAGNPVSHLFDTVIDNTVVLMWSVLKTLFKISLLNVWSCLAAPVIVPTHGYHFIIHFCRFTDWKLCLGMFWLKHCQQNVLWLVLQNFRANIFKSRSCIQIKIIINVWILIWCRLIFIYSICVGKL